MKPIVNFFKLLPYIIAYGLAILIDPIWTWNRKRRQRARNRKGY